MCIRDRVTVDLQFLLFSQKILDKLVNRLNLSLIHIYAMAFRNVYTFGPTFRAENSNTTRHAAEFWMIEPEMAFADLNDDMELAESMLKYVIRYVLEHAPEEMNFFSQFVDRCV